VMKLQQNSAELMWKDLLSSNDPEMVFVQKDEINEVTALFIESKIDPEKFSGNVVALLAERMPSGDKTQPCGSESPLPATPSIEKFLFLINRPPLVPLWFIAGFPDVFAWFGDRETELLASSPDNWEPVFTELLGMSLTSLEDPDDQGFEEEYSNADGKLKARYWRNLVTKYITESGKPLETAIQPGSANDPYPAVQLFEALGEQNNCTLIASVVTQYYLELRRSFASMVSDETSLLAMAGMLDAEYYISTRQVTPVQIVSAARDTMILQNRLLQFLIQFETLLLSCDNPQASQELVHSCCEEQTEVIQASIQRTMSSYQGNSPIIAKVRSAMLSPQYREVRKAVGIQ
jgi:hypothetical protein